MVILCRWLNCTLIQRPVPASNSVINYPCTRTRCLEWQQIDITVLMKRAFFSLYQNSYTLNTYIKVTKYNTNSLCISSIEYIVAKTYISSKIKELLFVLNISAVRNRKLYTNKLQTIKTEHTALMLCFNQLLTYADFYRP